MMNKQWDSYRGHVSCIHVLQRLIDALRKQVKKNQQSDLGFSPRNQRLSLRHATKGQTAAGGLRMQVITIIQRIETDVLQ